MICNLSLLITVMRAAEGALRQVGLHRSAADFEMLLHTFLAVQRRQGNLEGEAPQASTSGPGPAQPQFTPRRQPRTAQPRRIPGLTRKLG